ncbi:MAG: GTPase HflX [Alphaproteobacteria bacterium]
MDKTFHEPEPPACAYIVQPVVSSASQHRHIDDVLEEVEGLARAISLDVAGHRVVKVSKMDAGHFLGKGNRAAIAETVAELKPELVIFNHALSPVQQRNLEEEWNVKVIDRTGLILEIFSARAQTKEGRIQVELAALEYRKSRLVKAWSHLERQRGGTTGIGGPGETQKELDRRMIEDKIKRLKTELEKVRQTRELGRKGRERVPLPVVALVGYTNAGKSTLFNTLTGAGVFAEDLPFATLDPTTRRLNLPNEQQIVLSDTVGFISDLPTHLVASFRATLEQIGFADVILHVIDITKPSWKADREDVIKVLADLGITYEEDERILEIWNKADALEPEMRHALLNRAGARETILISALKGEGLEELLKAVTEKVSKDRRSITYELTSADGKALSWLYEHGEILEREDHENGVKIKVRLDEYNIEKFEKYYGYSAKT